MSKYTSCLLLACLPLLLHSQTTQTTLPYGLTKAQVDVIFNDFLWAASQVDASYATSTNVPKIPFNLTPETLQNLYGNFVKGLWSTSAGAPKQLPDVTFTFNLPAATSTTDTTNGNTSNTTSPQANFPNMAKAIFTLLNQYRAQNKLSQLTWSDDAAARALTQSQYMVAKGVLSHDNFSVRAKGFSYANENVAYFQVSSITDSDGASKFMEMWKNSAGHDANMKATQPTMCGVAVYKDVTSNKYYATMLNVKA